MFKLGTTLLLSLTAITGFAVDPNKLNLALDHLGFGFGCAHGQSLPSGAYFSRQSVSLAQS